MNIKNLTFRTLLLGCMLSISIFSCKKETASVNVDDDVLATEDNIQVDESISDTFVSLHEFSVENDDYLSDTVRSSFSTLASTGITPSISVKPKGNIWPKTVTFDFGGGITKNGVTRKGKIIAVYTDRLIKPNARVDITFENFYINDVKIEGTKSIVNNGKNANGNFTFAVIINETRKNVSKGQLIFSANRNIEWFKGEDSETSLDDEFKITGNSNGVTFKNKNYTTNITKALVKKVGCKFIVEGTIEISIKDKLKKTLDYGNGECDNVATLTINGNSKEIILKK